MRLSTRRAPTFALLAFALLALAIALLALALPAQASRPRLKLERIDPSEFRASGKVRLYASLVELEGNLSEPVPAQRFSLTVDGQAAGKPTALRRFVDAGEPLDLVLVIESSALYGPPPPAAPPPVFAPPPAPKSKGHHGRHEPPAPPPPPPIAPPPPSTPPLDRVKEAVAQLLDGLPNRYRVEIIEYGGDVTAHPPFRDARGASRVIDELEADAESGDLRLADALKAALRELGKGSSARKLVLLVSDGLNAQMDRKLFRTLGDAARQAGVPIHSIAFSPTDDRVPLLNLGELSKRSNGTFRWAKSADELKKQIDTLAEELTGQYVLTFPLEVSALEGHTFVLSADEAAGATGGAGTAGGAGIVRSNPLAWTGAPVHRRLPLWAWVAFGLAGLAAIGVLVALRRRRQAANEGAPATSGQTSRTTGQTNRATGQTNRAAAGAAPARAPAAAPASPRAILQVVTGARTGERVALSAEPLLIGKAGALRIDDDPAVSSRHAHIWLDRGACVVEDLGSTNGTFVNNQRIATPTRLADGDLVRVGNTQLKLRID